jgi:hypothetical protein
LNAPSLPHTPAVFQELGDLNLDDMPELRRLYRAIAETALEALAPEDDDEAASGAAS